MPLDKRTLIDQLLKQLRHADAVTQQAAADSRDAAANLATESEKKEDGRAAIEFGSLATGQAHRSRQLQAAVSALMQLKDDEVPRYSRRTPVGLGALVDVAVEDEDGEGGERTFFVLPAGAGSELTGPGGDGYLSVITPVSPVGRALMGKRVGETVEVQIQGEARVWTILDLA